jgi:23S rRNA C2498 (ribose-2'-O)-methylase RlmM
VGAAPGGWTRLLAQACAPVYAIDPANLDPDVVALPNVVHIKGLVGKRGYMCVWAVRWVCVCAGERPHFHWVSTCL